MGDKGAVVLEVSESTPLSRAMLEEKVKALTQATVSGPCCVNGGSS